MKAATLRRFKAVHSTVGMLTGLLLFVAFFAGALTLFHHPLEAWAEAGREPAAARRESASADRPQALDQAQRLLDAVALQEPRLRADLRLVLPGEGEAGPRVVAQDPQRRVLRQFELDEHGALQERAERGELADFLYRLHYTAGIPTPWGTYVLGLVSLLYGLALVSGVVIYAPVLVRDLMAMRWGHNLKRLWQDVHNALGMLSLPFHLVFAWSGAVLGLGALLLAPFQLLVYDGKLIDIIGPQAGFSRPVPAQRVPAPLRSVAELVAAAEQAVPGLVAERLHLRLMGDAAAHVEVDGRVDQRRLSPFARVELQGSTARVVAFTTPQTYSLGTALLRGLQSLHFGDYAGWLLRWLYFALALGAALLFYSGNLLWVESRRRHQQVLQPGRALLMARLTVGAALGCVAGVAALFVLVRLAGQGASGPWLSTVYFAVLLAALLWALCRPLALAAQQLCAVAALLGAGIVGADVWALGALALTEAARGELTLLSVDLLALGGAALLLAASRSVRRRALTGPAHSVWALPQPAATAPR